MYSRINRLAQFTKVRGIWNPPKKLAEPAVEQLNEDKQSYKGDRRPYNDDKRSYNDDKRSYNDKHNDDRDYDDKRQYNDDKRQYNDDKRDRVTNRQNLEVDRERIKRFEVNFRSENKLPSTPFQIQFGQFLKKDKEFKPSYQEPKDYKKFNGKLDSISAMEHFKGILRNGESVVDQVYFFIDSQARQLKGLLDSVKEDSLKVLFDLQSFTFMFNYERFERENSNFMEATSVVGQYIGYMSSEFPQHNFPNLSTIFAICRQVSHGAGHYMHNDVCSEILRTLGNSGRPLESTVNKNELALWTKPYLQHPMGLKFILHTFRSVQGTIHMNFEDVLNDIEHSGGGTPLELMVQS